jgi:hypothetical protein
MNAPKTVRQCLNCMQDFWHNEYDIVICDDCAADIAEIAKQLNAEHEEEMVAAGMMEALFPSDGIFWKNPDGTLTKIEPEED